MTYHRFSLSNSSFEENRVDTIVPEQLSPYKGCFLADWSKRLGFGRDKTLKHLKNQVNEGKMSVFRVPIIDITGRINHSTVYVPKKDSDGSKE